MSRAKNKGKATVVPDIQERIKAFEAAMVEIMKQHQIGLRPYNDKYGPKLEYVDLVNPENKAA